MIKSVLRRPAAVLWAIFIWKLVLLVFTAQPVPSNDAFFYDGPVVNFLLHGKYANPSIALALPISGREVFCAYPPLYQAVLLGWMSVFGTSVMSPMVLHLALFGIYLLILSRIFSRLAIPPWACYLASAFVLVITFTDRPDSLAHVLGMGAVYCWVRTLGMPEGSRSGWLWAMAGLVVLSLCTGIQIGGFYFLVIWTGVFTRSYAGRSRFPIGPMAALTLLPVALVLMVVICFPHLWAGFSEHARQTPALTGLRSPKLGEVLKLLRTMPGIIAISGLFAWRAFKRLLLQRPEPTDVLLVACVLPSLAIAFGAMFVLTPNAVSFAAYVQPLAVAVCLIAAAAQEPVRDQRALVSLFAVLAALGSVRAIGMTTWGVACAADVSQHAALERVRQEIAMIAPGQPAVFSGAYLHEAAPRGDFRWLHSDWLVPAKRDDADPDWKALLAVKPVTLVLTQFDYYRRYQPVLERLQGNPELATFKLTDTARLRTPDSIKSFQKVVQHISWAPIIVNITWK